MTMWTAAVPAYIVIESAATRMDTSIYTLDGTYILGFA